MTPEMCEFYIGELYIKLIIMKHHKFYIFCKNEVNNVRVKWSLLCKVFLCSITYETKAP